MVIGYDDGGNELYIGDTVNGVSDGYYGIAHIEGMKIIYHNFGYCVEDRGFFYYLNDFVELHKVIGNG